MSMAYKNDSAFPYPVLNSIHQPQGLTKREYFAGLAMQGLCANSVPGPQHRPEFLSREALEQADALIKALNEGEQ